MSAEYAFELSAPSIQGVQAVLSEAEAILEKSGLSLTCRMEGQHSLVAVISYALVPNEETEPVRQALRVLVAGSKSKRVCYYRNHETMQISNQMPEQEIAFNEIFESYYPSLNVKESICYLIDPAKI